MKFIDLADAIKADHGWTRAAIESILEWLDEHPDQVPGRTITESEFHETADAHRNGGLGWEDLARRFGITVTPDPEPTNTEKLADDIREVDGGHNLGAGVLAERLASLGWTKAPGAGES